MDDNGGAFLRYRAVQVELAKAGDKDAIDWCRRAGIDFHKE